MDNHLQVSIKMESVWEEETTLQIAEGILYERSGNWFLRYEEPDVDNGVITATIKFKLDQVKLMRRGSVESDMTFEVGVIHPGFYTTSLINMLLETTTTEILVELQEGKGRVMWSYKLITPDDSSSLRRVTVWLS